ncbi:glycosyltransferase family 2 protein [Diaphorobacter sp. ED-3]|uniref:glycosyltransferase family 2 protein n=1 Tax=Diaphorobacter sp. ED-3 TaxID=3016636 RepID=UPI0022DDF837|nr:glycosyltransferase family 2 protein [Diaphorobacter sp. ED-3]
MQDTTVHILMATYQGARYLPKQLASIEAQQGVVWKLWVSDDGSTDSTLDLLHAFAQAHPGHVHLLKGPGLGAARHFGTLIHAVQGLGTGDLVAFCDQDDVWLPGKLARAAHWHAARAMPGRPCLYMARTVVTDEALHPLYLSRRPRRLGLGNALVENAASGNTMVLNAALLQAVRRIRPEHMVLHDWSTYLAATACGGELTYDERPCLLYRQHGGNVVGARPGWKRRIKRLWELGKGNYREWGQATEGALADLEPLLATAGVSAAASYRKVRHGASVLERLRQARRAGLRRQRRLAQAGLLGAVALGLL